MTTTAKATAATTIPCLRYRDAPAAIEWLCKALGFDAAAVAMEDDAPELSDDWSGSEDITAPARWAPTPPAGEGWMLVAKYDTEDGPHAMFVRPN